MVMVVGITALSLWWHRPVTAPETFMHVPPQNPHSGPALLTLGRKISLNEANAEDLMALPGIGPERAASIIAWRDKHGPFVRKEELKKVPGIGPQTFQRLAPSIEISSTPSPRNK